MHLGNLATIGNHSPPNLKHIVINNGAHDSVGGQPTDAARMEDFRITQIALGVGYKQVSTIHIELFQCCMVFIENIFTDEYR